MIRLTHGRIGEVLGSNEDFDLEIVYVDDGSKDRSPALLSEIAEFDPRVCVITLSRNFGHQPAVTAGLRHASGDVVAVIDADLQDPVELIPEMVDKWREGYSAIMAFAAIARSQAADPLLQPLLSFAVTGFADRGTER